MAKPRRTRIRALEGRIIEKATIWGNDADEGDQDYIGPSLEIRTSGGIVFTFTAAPIPAATSTLSRDQGGNIVADTDPREWK